MITENEIHHAEERENLLSESFLKGVMDFIKWTSTIAIAAILWVGNSITSVTGLPWIISIASLIFLIFSLIVAVLAVKRVLKTWADEWDIAKELYILLLMKKLKSIEPSIITEQKETEQITKLIKSADPVKSLSRSEGFICWVTLHTGLLLVGLLMYVFARFLGKL
jgi:ABC-type multidrug transport system fused ATPase/permease subunit